MQALNIAALCKTRPLHCFDLLGFGQSSRPQFSTVPEVAEKEFLQSIEDWREAESIDKMVLLGHSFGGYLAAAYTMKHPERFNFTKTLSLSPYSRFETGGGGYTSNIFFRVFFEISSKFQN